MTLCLRDMIAIEVMKKMLSSGERYTHEWIAKESYQLADTMLVEKYAPDTGRRDDDGIF